MLLTAAKLARAGVGNVRLACTDARWLLHNAVPDESVQAVHVYFPDPWWKKRHRKRKLFTADFAAECARVLRPGGGLFYATDVADAFAETLAILHEHPQLTPARHPSPAAGDEALTSFERKYRREGRRIHRSCWTRVSRSR